MDRKELKQWAVLVLLAALMLAALGRQFRPDPPTADQHTGQVNSVTHTP